MKPDRDLYAFRRHLRTCIYFGLGGRAVRLDKCSCPFHIDGCHNGERVRRGLKTRSRQVAERRVTDVVRTLDCEAARNCGVSEVEPAMGIKVAPLSVEDAVTQFLKSHGCVDHQRKYRGDLEHGTWRKYRNSLGLFALFCKTHGVAVLMDITLDTLEDFRATRRITLVELQALKTFFNYCLNHKWLTANPAKLMKGPRTYRFVGIINGTAVGRILAGWDSCRTGAVKFLLTRATLES